MKLIALPVAAVLLLAGCTAAPAEDDGLVQVVASTNVYGDIAATIGGDAVEVTSIIDDPSQDPHSFEGSARVQLALSKADLVIENGGGYDDFVDTLLGAAGNPDATVLTASDLSGLDVSSNEHVWYSFSAMDALAAAITDALSEADPASADLFAQNAAAFRGDLSTLAQSAATAATRVEGTGVAITEPVPGYLLDALGLVNVTPEEFSEAVEEGTDVSPLVLAETEELFEDGSAAILVYNEQTTGPETERVIAAATAAGAGVVPVTETLPAGEDYISWMTANLDAIAAALR